jgi:hypothetical protein
MLTRRMLTNIRVRDFKCLRDVEVQLGPLTVLIGKNDTGKTSFLEALLMLGRASSGDTDSFGGGIEPLIRHGAQEGAVRWTATLEGNSRDPWRGRAVYDLTLAPPSPEFVTEAARFYVRDESIEIAQRPDMAIERGGKEPSSVPLTIREGDDTHTPGRRLGGASYRLGTQMAEVPRSTRDLPGAIVHDALPFRCQGAGDADAAAGGH